MRSLLDNPAVDSALSRLFRLRTRRFMQMDDTDGAVPAVPVGGAHLYVHIPFCPVLCPFCSFHRVQYKAGAARRYFAALRDEIRLYQSAGHGFSGVYFGGGTPTCEPAELVRTIRLVRELFGVSEISVETNPLDLRPEILEPLRDAGVTRLSVGVQSFDDRLLREMGRLERCGGGRETAARIQAVAGMFPTFNVDLIFNQAHQTVAGFEADLATFRSLGANQVSCYPLMTSPGVRAQMAGAMGLPDRRRLRNFYRAMLRKLQPEFTASSAWCFTKSGHGNDEYIVSNENYVGVGSGAFSYLDGTLYSTTFNLGTYERRIAAGLTGITATRRLGTTDRMRYTLLVRMFGLGLDREWVRKHHGRKFLIRVWPELLTLRVLGAATCDRKAWRLTERGMFWLMLMMSQFFESVNACRETMRLRAEREHVESPCEGCAGAGVPSRVFSGAGQV
jgi:coproporphyrinogen III oxidase-like Fe-S oxidoreductase